MSQNQENKICQNCKKNFVIEQDDFNFYEKIKVPAPTWCPECRLRRRLVWRNERVLYRKECFICKKNVISLYPQESDVKILCQNCWWGDQWNPEDFSKEINFSESFVSQIKELFYEVPQMSLLHTNSINSDYCNYSSNNKNCYLIFGGKNNENVFYSHNSVNSKDTSDSSASEKLEFCYEDIECKNSSRLLYSKNCENCIDSFFLYECRNCSNCLGCTNLRNKNYCLFNKQYTKEEYLKEVSKLNLSSYNSKKFPKEQFDKLCLSSIHKFSYLTNTINCTGNNIKNARNTKLCFDILGNDSENNKYTVFVALGVKDSWDNYGMSRAEMLYETMAIGFDSNENQNIRFSFFIRGGSDVLYSINCSSSHHLFACVGLRNKQYCILNKQYTKEQYEELVPKIIQHMNDMPYTDSKGRVYKYGEFFPSELSPFCYNETIAQEYFPLTKEQAIEQGYK